MNSEKVKEIKKGLSKEEIKEILKKRIENINPWETHALEYHKGLLDLINELESENERFVESCKNCHYIKDLEIANGHAKELKDRIAELEKELETRKEEVLHLQEYGKKLIRETELKQFVEGLKEKSFYIETIEDTYNVVELSTVYATLKEYVK